MRLFVALPVASEAVARVDRAVAPVRESHPAANWTSPDTWHVTLAFIGEVDDELLPTVVDAVASGVARATARPRCLMLGEAGRFGRRVLWMGIDDQPIGAISLLGLGVKDALREAGVPVDDKPVVPHLTLARARGRKGQLPSGLVEAVPDLDGAWDVTDVHVVRSHLGEGVRHETVATVPLT